VLDAVLAGAGICLLPQWLVARDLRDRRLKQVLADWQTPTTTAWAVCRTESRSAARIRAFVDAMST
jgi:DNA-binding transcriptional LysR family regulator